MISWRTGGLMSTAGLYDCDVDDDDGSDGRVIILTIMIILIITIIRSS